MISVICGKKGSGKTKQLLNGANERAKNAKGSVVFIDHSNSCMFDLARNIRYINACEYHVSTADMLFGFLSGIAAQDSDIECICIDGFKNYISENIAEVKDFFTRLEGFCEERKADIVISISEDKSNLPDFMMPFIVSPAE